MDTPSFNSQTSDEAFGMWLKYIWINLNIFKDVLVELIHFPNEVVSC